MIDELSNLEVNDRTSFVHFLELLHKDYLENRDEWENANLGDFLEALSRYAEDIQGYYDNSKINIDANQPSWKTFADIFMGAKIYE